MPAIKSYHVSAYLAELTLTGKEQPASTPTVKQHLAAFRMLFDWLIIGQVIDVNPAAAVRGRQARRQEGQNARAQSRRGQAAARQHPAQDRHRSRRKARKTTGRPA